MILIFYILTLSGLVSSGQSIFSCDSNPEYSYWRESHCQYAWYETNYMVPDCCGYTYNGESWNMLFIGTPRSGTTYVAELFKLLGFYVGNDNQCGDKAGMSAWRMAINSQNQSIHFHCKGRVGRFRHIFHLVRNPIAAIPSVTTQYPSFTRHYENIKSGLEGVNFRIEEDNTTELVRWALQTWVAWNSRIDRMSNFIPIPLLRVEELDIPLIMHMAKFPPNTIPSRIAIDAAKKKLGSQTNRRKHVEPLQWSDYCALDPEFTRRAMDMAKIYGYIFNDTCEAPI